MQKQQINCNNTYMFVLLFVSGNTWNSYFLKVGFDRRHHRCSGSEFKAQTVSLALLTSPTSLLSGSKHFFFINPKDSSYLYLLPSLLVNFLAYSFFIFNFKTQLAIICVFRLIINCFPFLIPKWIDKISNRVNHRTYLLFLYYVYLNKHFNIKFIPNTTGRGQIIAIFFLFLSDYFYVIQYTPSSTS